MINFQYLASSLNLDFIIKMQLLSGRNVHTVL
jgi:hypothetical protein